MKSFELNNYQLSVLQNKRKVYSNLYGYLDHAYFKLSEKKLDFALIGASGMVKTSIDIDYTGDTQYFSIDYKKFDTILQKFALDEKIKLSLSDSLLKISAISRSDTVNLQIVTVKMILSQQRTWIKALTFWLRSILRRITRLIFQMK